MKNKINVMTILCVVTLPTMSYAQSPTEQNKNFKRFSISAGWLHAMPQGSGNPLNNQTAVAEGTQSTVGEVSKNAVLDAAVKESSPLIYNAISISPGDNIPAAFSGTANINGLSSWQSADTGMQANNVDTLGIMMNYYLTDHWSVELKVGIPPTVNLTGKGDVYAPLRGSNTPALAIGSIDIPLGSSIDLNKNIHVTDLSQGGKAASVRAWLPALELHYQFGQSGVNKFRPYIGAGVLYGYFDKVQLNSGIESDLIASAHRIQNILDNKAGAALDGKVSSASPQVKVEATSAFAPIVTLGASYDFNDKWFAVGSISYAKMNNQAKITVIDSNTGNELIRANTKIDIDPFITYLGVGYRF